MNQAVQSAIRERIQDLHNYIAHCELFPKMLHRDLAPSNEIYHAQRQIVALMDQLTGKVKLS